MTSAVTDTSVLFKILVDEPDSSHAISFVTASEIHVPDLVYAEVGNAIWARVHDGRLTVDEALELADKFNAAAFQVHPIRPHLRRAMQIAATLDHPVYDCVYLALAGSLDVPLVTADARFLRALARRPFPPVDVRTLSDFA